MTKPKPKVLFTVSVAIEKYLSDVFKTEEHARSRRTYRNALRRLEAAAKNNGQDTIETKLEEFNWESAVGDYLSNCPIETDQEPKAGRRKTYAARTLMLRRTVLSRFIRWLKTNKHLSTEKAQDLLDIIENSKSQRENPGSPDYSTQAVEALLKYMQTLPDTLRQSGKAARVTILLALRDRSLIFLLADTGLRNNEARTLTREKINWDAHTIRVIGKGNVKADVRLSQRAVRYLREYLTVRGEMTGENIYDPQTIIFVRHKGETKGGNLSRPLPPASIKNIVESSRKKAVKDLPLDHELRATHITPHSFRHYFVTRILRRHGNVANAQRLARHKDIGTTSLYAHPDEAELDDAYREAYGEFPRRKE